MTTAMQIVACVLFAAWGTGMLIALWFKPRLLRLWLFVPRWRGGFNWRHGLRASRGSLILQALLTYSLTALIVCRLIGAGSRQAMLVFVALIAANAIAWVIDGANAAARES
ncbi:MULTISPECIES: hypothetical protein [unclassified Lysobacter]|uniref:hypothetical protein n=1 Tax=unclassified Lysobacter TaxID=2635362 RepID=UPI0006FCEFFA|nr:MULTISPECIES: hypothetical protein [unclassified Lysobacter]HWU79860.1 hypothetical protein [Caulobacter sp.]KQZ57735.1 hypothetical protein ASD53_08975 [Lysobacter sp. Root559]KRA74396.1 hypothetical protein ASD78_13015 [Lysobacter sp. Root667]KRC33883.1 hypothetical protein ASE10_13135 [Lysobacter sp. Root76]KRD69219.1 hypothetical protein ASE45_08575 [Lysobacter sp. Root96]